jgi:hypothetical protein
MVKCWSLEPEDRPSFANLVETLSTTLFTMSDYTECIKQSLAKEVHVELHDAQN